MMQENKAFLSGLGVMGRRHLQGLLKAGFSVTAFDPRLESREAAQKEVIEAGLSEEGIDWMAEEFPAQSYEVAIFSETAPYRLENVGRFLEASSAKRILVEKPFTADPSKLKEFHVLFEKHHVTNDQVQCNLSRRHWPLIQSLKSLCEGRRFTMTISGGAVGLGCNGVHHLDTFLHLAGQERLRIDYAKVDSEWIPSGRGADFRDHGGSFLLGADNATCFLSLSATSSAAPLITVIGDGFSASFDEGNLQYRIAQRRSDSKKPVFFCGHDYDVIDSGTLELLPMSELTAQWAVGRLQLPSFEYGVNVHEVLFGMLESGGEKGPYHFT